MENLPTKFLNNTHEIYGEKGREWLDHLPELLASYEERWSIRVLPPFADLSYNYVAPVIRADGSPAVLKIWIPNAETRSEMAALRHFNGGGINRLLEAEPDQGAMLLERLIPGVSLATLEDDEAATRISAEVMRELWIPAPADPEGVFPSTEKWSRGLQRLRQTFDGGTGPFPTRLIEQAERTFADLEASATTRVLLHGDLHHWNILSAQRRPWLALDPKGVTGEPAYEVAQMLLNRLDEGNGKAGLQRQADRRLAVFEEMLGFDRQRMLGWTFAKAVLSAWWTYEDNHRVDHEMIHFSTALSEMIDHA